MEAIAILALVFLAGACAGYALRARISNNRRKKYLQYSMDRPKPG